MSTKTSGLKTVAQGSVILQGQSVNYTLKVSLRARGARLEIRDGGLVVILPRSCPRSYLNQIVTKKQDWVLRHLSRPVKPQITRKLRFGSTVSFLGEKLKLVREDGPKTSVKYDPGRLTVALHYPHNLERILEVWLRFQANRILSITAREIGAKMGVQFNRLTVRGQRSRWGSCSQKGNLNVNWRIIMAPKPVIDYVIIHELAHLKEMNHSKRFWQVVAERCPEWREHRKWLRANQERLGSWGNGCKP